VLEVRAYRSSFSLLDFSPMSSSEAGAQSRSPSALTRGANDSIACLFTLVRWSICKRRGSSGALEGRTSQFSRMKQSPPATDLSGPKASAESLTPRRSNPAVADTVDFQVDLFPSAGALGSILSLGRRASSPLSGMAEVPTLPEGTIRGSDRKTIVYTYCRVSQCAGWE